MSTVNESINKIIPQGVTINIANELSNFISSISSNIAKILSVTFSALLSFILMILVMFYFLKDGEHFRKLVKVLSPLPDNDDEKIIKRLSDAVNAVIKGYLLIALIQGTLMGIGLWVFEVPNPALWGLVAAIASLLPMIGTAIVAVPSIIFLLATSNPGAAIGLLIWSLVLVGTIDNFLSPYFVGGRIKIPSILVLFSVLGGIYLLGPIGILMGPLTVSLLYTLISIYRNEYKQTVA
jgi:predicted PurR-regulated permease PerM